MDLRVSTLGEDAPARVPYEREAQRGPFVGRVPERLRR